MNHTKNYNLPQWELNDLIRMEDFNSAMANIETGLSEGKQRDDSLSSRVDAARAMAAQLPYVVGEYEGNSQTEWNEINIGFRPSFVLITCQTTAPEADSSLLRFALLGTANSGNFGKLTETGFAVRMLFPYLHPQINYQGLTYSYIAFR